MINLPIKFEVSTFSRYGDMKCVKKCTKWGWFGVVMGHPRSLAMSPFNRAHMTSYSSLIETMCLCCTVFEIRRVICQNSRILTYRTCIWLPHWGQPRSNFEKISGIRKLESLAITRRCLRHLRLAVLVEHRLVTDTHTHTNRHRQTDDHGIYLAEHSSRGKNKT